MDNETSIRLIELYGSFNELWNPQNKEYFNKNLREDLWDKIAQNLELPKKELKAKMKSLLSSYRRERSREKESTVTGSGRNQSYKSKWFAYEAFNFLHDKNNPIDTSDTMVCNDYGGPSINADSNINEATENSASSRASDKIRKRQPAKRKNEDTNISDAENLMIEEAMELIRNKNDVTNDPYTAFGMHIASELKKYDPVTLAQVKRSINNIIFKADMALLNQQTTHYHEERRPGYSTAQQLTDLSNSLASNSTDNGSGLTQLIRDMDA